MLQEALKNPYERMDTAEDIHREMQDAVEVYESELREKVELQQAVISEAVSAITALNKIKKPYGEKVEDVYAVFDVTMPFFPDVNEENIKIGILSEVCVRLSLEELGFSVIEPSNSDDFQHAIDMYADPKDGTIWAIQVKGHRNIPEPIVDNLLEGKAPDESTLSDAQIQERLRARHRIINYVLYPNFEKEHPEFKDKKVIPIIIHVPSGGTKDIFGAFKATGEPVAGFKDQLYDKILQAMNWEGEY